VTIITSNQTQTAATPLVLSFAHINPRTQKHIHEIVRKTTDQIAFAPPKTQRSAHAAIGQNLHPELEFVTLKARS
jgi:hypothetical protein